jgi:DNA topoisomerase IB
MERRVGSAKQSDNIHASPQRRLDRHQRLDFFEPSEEQTETLHRHRSETSMSRQMFVKPLIFHDLKPSHVPDKLQERTEKQKGRTVLDDSALRRQLPTSAFP